MVSGIECAGLLIGILPLFIEAGKAYANGVDTLMSIADASRRDEALEDFYDDFHEQVVEINEHVSWIYYSISQTAKGGSLPTPTEFFTKWQDDPSIENALRAYFGSDDRFNRFTRISSKIVQLLGSLIKDKAIKLSAKDLGEEQMFQKLKDFASSRLSNVSRTSLRDRIRFFTGKRDRDKFLRRLQDCTGKLRTLISRVEKQGPGVQLGNSTPAGVSIARAQSATVLSLKVRSVIENLYSVLAKFWSCNCNARHEVRLRLSEEGYPRDETNVALEFLVSVQSTDTSCRWQEAKVFVTSKRNDAGSCARKHPEKLCDLSQTEIGMISLNFILEDIGGHPTMWQLPPKPRTLQFLDNEDPSSLYELLDGPGKMSRKEKLKLAITLSYSLLFLHDSDWLSRGWKKEDIFFFYKREDEPDYASPYLSARFTGIKESLNSNEGNGALVPPNEGILSLGILLLEILEEKPIERWRTSRDKQNLYAFTDWNVAERVVGKMDPSPSQSAVLACLNWMREVTGEIRLERQEVRLELFKRVIAPLEEEMELLEINWKQWAL